MQRTSTYISGCSFTRNASPRLTKEVIQAIV